MVDLALGGVQLGLLRRQLLYHRIVIRRAHIGSQRRLILGITLIQFGLPPVQQSGILLILGQAVLIVRQALAVLLQACVILLQTGVVLLLGLLQPDLGIGQFSPAVPKLPLQGGGTVIVVPPAVIQLAPGIIQLRPGVGQLLFGLLSGVIQLPLGVVDLLLCLAHDGLLPQVGPLLSQGFQAVHQLAHPAVVLIAVAVQAGQADTGEIGDGVIVRSQVLTGHENDAVQRTVSQRGGAPVSAHIQGADHGAHYGEGVPRQSVLVPLLQGQFQCISQLQAQLGQQERIHNALIRRLGQAAPDRLKGIEPLRHGTDIDDTVGGGGVHHAHALHRLHPVRPGQSRQVLVGNAKGGDDIAVHKSGAVKVVVGGVLHIGRRGPQAGQERHRQGGQHQNGQKPAESMPDLPEGVGEQAVFPLYHSISSTGVGCSLSSIFSTFPLLIWITRSAMGVRAVLWVMTTTVMPSCRQVSCSSFRICLPVT